MRGYHLLWNVGRLRGDILARGPRESTGQGELKYLSRRSSKPYNLDLGGLRPLPYKSVRPQEGPLPHAPSELALEVHRLNPFLNPLRLFIMPLFRTGMRRGQDRQL